MTTEYNLAEMKLTYKTKVKAADRIKVTKSEEAYRLLLSTYPEDTIEHNEYFKVIYLNNANHVLGWSLIGMGGIDGTFADVRLILQTALLCNATAMILAHNHPSGGLRPSMQDLSLTKAICEAAKTMNIRVVDHIILTADSFYSFADDGRI
jgi:DNA repair protein RadC